MSLIFDKNSTLREIKRCSELSGREEWLGLFTLDDGKLDLDMTLKDVADHISPAWNADDMADGLNLIVSNVRNGNQVFFQIYTEEECAADESKNRVGIMYFPVNSTGPFFLVAAGGAYRAVASSVESFPVAKHLNELGCNAFVLNYRAGEFAATIKGQEDLHTAIRYILKNKEKFHVTDRYVCIGFSAGGHLMAELGTENLGYQQNCLPKPTALFLGYPFVSFGDKRHEQWILDNMFGTGYPPEYYQRKVKEYNPIEHVTENFPPVYVWQTVEDEQVPYNENAEQFYNVLNRKGVKCQLKRVEHGLHGLGLGRGSEAEGWLDEAVAFWNDL